MKKIKVAISSLIYIGAALCLLASCQNDIYEPEPGNFKGIGFNYTIEEIESVRTRSDLDSSYISTDPYNLPFYIELNCEQQGAAPFVEYGTYKIPSGYEGRLQSVDPEEALDWHDLTSKHTFYSWTVPWKDEYQPSTDTLRVNFFNSSEEDGFNAFHNNSVYETFIGAKSAAYSYDKHGKYVELTYHHLVSKILINDFILMESNGSLQENLKANITFVGMPKWATFYPHPVASDPSGAPANSGPYVGLPWDQSADDGVTYFINNSATEEDWFYICPEVDFSNLDFQVKLTNTDYAGYDTYYGTFDDVVFERKPGSKYDKGDGTDDKVLHAGEMMTLNITLIPGVGPGLKIIIDNWSTDKPTESRYHTYPGMYSDAEINELLDACFKQREYYTPDPKIDDLFDLYGEEVEGEKIFYLYENVTLYAEGSNTNLSNIFPVPDGYIINGMGHTVTMRTNNGIAATDYVTYFNVGPVRDLYLTDGTNTIYIDPDGFVWIQDENGDLVNSGNQLPPLQGEQKGYDINIKGKIRPTTYYNGKLTDSTES